MGVIGPGDHEYGGYLRFRRKYFRAKKASPPLFTQFLKSCKLQTFSTIWVIGPGDHEYSGYLRFRRKYFRVKKWLESTFRIFSKLSKSPADFMVRCTLRYQYAVQTVFVTVVVARISRFRPRLCHRPECFLLWCAVSPRLPLVGVHVFLKATNAKPFQPWGL